MQVHKHMHAHRHTHKERNIHVLKKHTQRHIHFLSKYVHLFILVTIIGEKSFKRREGFWLMVHAAGPTVERLSTWQEHGLVEQILS